MPPCAFQSRTARFQGVPISKWKSPPHAWRILVTVSSMWLSVVSAKMKPEAQSARAVKAT